ncbi:MAG TPA: Gfo/Idh/MocA family oxidoreductase [Dongiaceae bacterium]|nr:Gfo/Idh/MocA family oxidoreductase [Dongiaceae bacterium]
MTRSKRNYELAAKPADRIFPAPRLPYEPPQPRRYPPKIGLIGCGGITASHLRAYRAANWSVVAMCDRNLAAAELRRREFYPQAQVYQDYRQLLARPDVDVVDIALHPEPRAAVIAAALNAGKHVLSQKPFVLDLDVGKRLVALARRRKRLLAVNQNGRWAPYFSYLYQAVRAGCVGDVQTVSMQLNWDHTWIRNTPFEKMPHVLLYDFAIHWFDMTARFFQDRKARAVFAFNARAPGQSVKPPLLGGATVAFVNGMATLHFDAHSRFDSRESIGITGTTGTLRAEGAICAAHQVTLTNRRGMARPELTGKWFDDGFRGAMGELLCAIETGRTPANAAETVLPGLALCFAAVQSARCGEAVVPGTVRKLNNESP